MDDSVYLMMCERNGDLVTMASYAPLFVNVNHRSWGVNLIEFDSTRSFAHASYYVQKIFNETKPDVNLATMVDVTPKPDPEKPLFAGRFGLGAWSTVNEFKEFRVYNEKNEVIFSDDFTSLDHWDTPGIGQWKVEGGVLKQTDPGKSPAMLFLKKDLAKGRITVKARRVGGNEGFLMFFNAAGPERFMFCNYGAAGNHFSAIQGQPSPDIATKGGGDLQGAIENERWYEITLDLTKNTAEARLDDKRISRIEAEALPAFFATGGYDRDQQAVGVRATNYGAKPVHANLRLDGVSNVSAKGRHIIIRADDPNQENTLEKPTQIVPQEVPLNGCAREFAVDLPPHSVNVLVIPARK